MSYEALFEDEENIFGGSPRSKFMDIIFNANRGLVEAELERLMTRMAAMEILLEDQGIVDFEHVVKQMEFERADELMTLTKSLYIESVGNVVTQNG